MFSTAAAMWPALYHLLFQADERQMKFATLKEKVSAVATVFGIRLNYFRADKKAASGYTKVDL